MSNQALPEPQERLLLSMFGTDEEKKRYERVKRNERAMHEALDHKHRLKPTSFNEETGVAVFACKCGYEVTRQASIMCFGDVD